MKSRLLIVAVCLLVVSTLFVEEVEGRRKILRGRKTVTRTYYKESAIPAWAIILLVGLGQVIIGGVLYVLMNKFYLGDLSEEKGTFTDRAKDGEPLNA